MYSTTLAGLDAHCPFPYSGQLHCVSMAAGPSLSISSNYQIFYVVVLRFTSCVGGGGKDVPSASQHYNIYMIVDDGL